jgi:hypothetical protein
MQLQNTHGGAKVGWASFSRVFVERRRKEKKYMTAVQGAVVAARPIGDRCAPDTNPFTRE